jgi:hypothetical protein
MYIILKGKVLVKSLFHVDIPIPLYMAQDGEQIGELSLFDMNRIADS